MTVIYVYDNQKDIPKAYLDVLVMSINKFLCAMGAIALKVI